MPISNHTAKQPAFYMEPIAMNQNKFYMPKSIMRPEGLNVEDMTQASAVAVQPAKEVKVAVQPEKEVKAAAKTSKNTKKEA